MEPVREETPKTPVKYSDDLLLELAESFGVSVEELVSSDFRDKVLSMDENADRVEELEEELEELDDELLSELLVLLEELSSSSSERDDVVFVF